MQVNDDAALVPLTRQELEDVCEALRVLGNTDYGDSDDQARYSELRRELEGYLND